MIRCPLWLAAALLVPALASQAQEPTPGPALPTSLEREVEAQQQRLLELIADPTIESLRDDAELREIARNLPALQAQQIRKAREAALESSAPDS